MSTSEIHSPCLAIAQWQWWRSNSPRTYPRALQCEGFWPKAAVPLLGRCVWPLSLDHLWNGLPAMSSLPPARYSSIFTNWGTRISTSTLRDLRAKEICQTKWIQLALFPSWSMPRRTAPETPAPRISRVFLYFSCKTWEPTLWNFLAAQVLPHSRAAGHTKLRGCPDTTRMKFQAENKKGSAKICKNHLVRSVDFEWCNTQRKEYQAGQTATFSFFAIGLNSPVVLGVVLYCTRPDTI